MSRNTSNGILPRWSCVELEIIEQNAQCTLKRKIRQIIFGNIYVSETALKQQQPIRIQGNNVKYGDVVTFLDNRRVASGAFVCSQVSYPNFGAEDIISELINQENEIRQFAIINNCASDNDSLFLTICKCYKFLNQRLLESSFQNSRNGQKTTSIFSSPVIAQTSFADKLKNMSQNHQSQSNEVQQKTDNNDETVKVEVFDDDDQPVINNFVAVNQLQMSGQMTSQFGMSQQFNQLQSSGAVPVVSNPFQISSSASYDPPGLPLSERKMKLTDLAVSALGESDAMKRRKEELLGDYELCVVCGDVSTGVHYGAETCEGCKGFFRRITQNNLTPRLCSNDNRCIKRINRRNRTQCPSCRFAKCVQVGMSRDKMDETKLRLPKKRQHITENKILADDGKTLNLEKYPKLQPKTDRPVQSPRSAVPIPSAVANNLPLRLLEQANALQNSSSASPEAVNSGNPLALFQNNEQTTLLQKILSGQIPIEHLKNRAGSPQSVQPSSTTPTSAQEILELMRNLQKNQANKDHEETDNMRDEIANLEGQVKTEIVEDIPEEIDGN